MGRPSGAGGDGGGAGAGNEPGGEHDVLACYGGVLGRGIEAAQRLPALATWRRDVLGHVWEGWLAGRVAVIGDPTAAHGLRLLPRD